MCFVDYPPCCFITFVSGQQDSGCQPDPSSSPLAGGLLGLVATKIFAQIQNVTRRKNGEVLTLSFLLYLFAGLFPQEDFSLIDHMIILRQSSLDV